MAHAFLLTVLMNTASVGPGKVVQKDSGPLAPDSKKASDCDTQDKKVSTVLSEPKVDETKAIEEKALTDIGLKKPATVVPSSAIVIPSSGMGTCK
jgi:hypothetical protein